jgi:rhodanese-related sulfurtransferase
LTEKASETPAAAETNEVDREEARALLEKGAQLVDVRVGHEWEAGHIAGAIHLPLEELPERVGELDRDPRREPG